MAARNHPADHARRAAAIACSSAVLLEALLGEIRYLPAVDYACRRWDRKLGMRSAELARLNMMRRATGGNFHPSRNPEGSWWWYDAQVQRAAAIWSTTPFQRDVTAVLRRIGFPDVVAASLAPPARALYLAWAADRDMPPPRPPAIPRRGPKADLLLWASYFYRVEVAGWSTRALFNTLHLGMRVGYAESQHAQLSPRGPRRADAYWPRFDCNCWTLLRDRLKATRRLLGLTK